MYRDVTLAPDDIEWDAPVGRERLKDAAFNRAVFDEVLGGLGPVEALTQFTRLHRAVANQLIVTATDDPLSSSWAGKTIALCFRLKKCRNRARWAVRDALGTAGGDELIAALDVRYPRAEWGAETDES